MSVPSLHGLILTAVFLIVAGTPFVAWWWLSALRTRRRLLTVGAAKPNSPIAPATRWLGAMARAAAPLAKVSLPQEGWEAYALRRRFMHAGLRHPSAPVFFFAIKTVLAFCLPLALWIGRLALGAAPTQHFLSFLGLLCGAGFYGPNLVLAQLVKSRQAEIIEALPDALDLLTISVEAGLSLDAALNRVAREIELNSLTLAEELQLLSLELRSGAGRARALRNLALRTGVDDIEALVAMLVQSDKFGTSMGDALRVYAGVLRAKRQAQAEERAGKVAVKLIFPLVLCVFPAILLVVGGPAMIRITKVLPTLVQGG